MTRLSRHAKSLAVAVTATATLATAAVVAGTSVAGAQTSPPTTRQSGAVRLAYCHGHADAAIEARLTVLKGDLDLLNDATHLTAGDKSRLMNLITSDQSGLTSLKTTIDQTTDPTTCHTDALTIVTSYRIYVLVQPQVHLTIAADRVLAITQRLTDLAAKQQARITAAEANHKNVGDAQAKHDDMVTQIAAAQNDASGVPGEVLALTPSGYPGNRTTLQQARQQLQAARDAIRKAVQDAEAVHTDLV